MRHITHQALLKRFSSIAALLLISWLSAASAAETLTLTDYLGQVSANNWSYQGSQRQKAGSDARKREADLVFSPSFFTEAQIASDKKEPDMGMAGAANYKELKSETYTAGVSQTYPTGTRAKLYYSLNHYSYLHDGSPDTRYYTASPVVELTQPLWQNYGGRADKDNEEATRAQAEADAWNAESDLRTLLVNAEKSYWDLATSRELVQVRGKAMEEAQAIYDYVSKRASMNLTDRSDALQARASLETARLNLKSATHNEAAALRAFKAYANMGEAVQVPELMQINWDKVRALPDPVWVKGNRADVKAAEAAANATAANARILAEKDKPALDLKLSYALNGRDADLSSRVSDSLNWDKPTAKAGLTFSIPFNYSASKEARAGALLKEKAAQLSYKQKLLAQASDWRDLTAKLSDARERLELSYTIEEAQRAKLEYEKQRLKEGRTTTYQVLTFEQDYTNAQYTRVSAAAQVLSTLANLKLYVQAGSNPAIAGSKE